MVAHRSPPESVSSRRFAIGSVCDTLSKGTDTNGTWCLGADFLYTIILEGRCSHALPAHISPMLFVLGLEVGQVFLGSNGLAGPRIDQENVRVNLPRVHVETPGSFERLFDDVLLAID